MTEMLIVAVLGMIRGFIMAPIAASKYAKYLIKMRDYLDLLFPVSVYPKGAAFDESDAVLGLTKDKVAVPISAVNDATIKHGFTVPGLSN